MSILKIVGRVCIGSNFLDKNLIIFVKSFRILNVIDLVNIFLGIYVENLCLCIKIKL